MFRIFWWIMEKWNILPTTKPKPLDRPIKLLQKGTNSRNTYRVGVSISALHRVPPVPLSPSDKAQNGENCAEENSAKHESGSTGTATLDGRNNNQFIVVNRVQSLRNILTIEEIEVFYLSNKLWWRGTFQLSWLEDVVNFRAGLAIFKVVLEWLQSRVANEVVSIDENSLQFRVRDSF